MRLRRSSTRTIEIVCCPSKYFLWSCLTDAVRRHFLWSWLTDGVSRRASVVARTHFKVRSVVASSHFKIPRTTMAGFDNVRATFLMVCNRSLKIANYYPLATHLLLRKTKKLSLYKNSVDKVLSKLL